MVKITIITVSYNSATTIADTLKSISNQSYPHIEYIVVDGSSTDHTLDVIRLYGERITHLISEPDAGIYDAMNKGVVLATGDIIGILNADDVYADADILAIVAEHFECDELDALLGDVAFFRPEAPGKLIRRYDSGRFSPKRIAWGWMPAHPALFLRRSIYEDVGLFRTDYRIAGDFEFIARAFGSGKLRHRHVPKILVKMRLGGISTGGLRNTMLLNREVLRACRENDIKTNMFKVLSKYPAKALEFFRR